MAQGSRRRTATITAISRVDIDLFIHWANLNDLVSSVTVKERDDAWTPYHAVCRLRVPFAEFEEKLKARFGTFIDIS